MHEKRRRRRRPPIDAPPRTWTHTNHRREDASEMALIDKSACECDIGQRQGAIVQQLSRVIDAVFQEPTVAII